MSLQTGRPIHLVAYHSIFGDPESEIIVANLHGPQSQQITAQFSDDFARVWALANPDVAKNATRLIVHICPCDVSVPDFVTQVAARMEQIEEKVAEMTEEVEEEMGTEVSYNDITGDFSKATHVGNTTLH